MQHSEQLDQWALALSKIQAEVPAIPKDETNPFFKSKYADLPAVVECASPIITRHGMSVSQWPGFDGTHDTLTTMVVHVSGQWVRDTMRLHLPKSDPQGQGSAITYAKRYAYMAALGLVADEDDDGNSASKPRKQAPRPQPARPTPAAAPQAAPAARGPLTPEEIQRRREEAQRKAAGDDGRPYE